MGTAAAPAVKKSTVKYVPRKRTNTPPTTLAAFVHWKPEDGYKYEWNNGIVEKSLKMITPQNFYLVDHLTTLLEKTNPVQGGRLICEAGNMTSATQLRIPDIAYYTKSEIREAAQSTTWPVTAFAIEIISENDKINKVYKKLEEYFHAGVKVVWLIFPQLELVHVYTSPEQVTICKGKTICSAEAVIAGFMISATQLFDKGV